jgi:hypothetical protein
MRIFVPLLLASLAVALLPASAAHADSEEDEMVPAARPVDPSRQRFFVGLSGGVAWAHVKHPDLLSPAFVGPTLGMHAGYRATPQWAFGFDFSAIEHGVTRVEKGGFSTDSMLEPQVDCHKCTVPPAGGFPSSTSLLVGVAGPLVEFTPFGPEGFYVGASGGVAFVQLVYSYPGFGGSFRTGYRIHVAEIFNLALEAGGRAQYADGAGFAVYGAALFRPRF